MTAFTIIFPKKRRILGEILMDLEKTVCLVAFEKERGYNKAVDDFCYYCI